MKRTMIAALVARAGVSPVFADAVDGRQKLLDDVARLNETLSSLRSPGMARRSPRRRRRLGRRCRNCGRPSRRQRSPPSNPECAIRELL